MNIYIYMYTYICIHIYICICMYTYIYKYMCINVSSHYMCIYLYYTWERESAREWEFVCMCVCVCMRVFVCALIQIRVLSIHTNIRHVPTIPTTHSNLNIDTQKSTYVTNPVTAQIRLGTGRMHLVVWHGSCWYQIYLRHEFHKTHFVTDVTHELIESLDTDIVYMFMFVHVHMCIHIYMYMYKHIYHLVTCVTHWVVRQYTRHEVIYMFIFYHWIQWVVRQYHWIQWYCTISLNSMISLDNIITLNSSR